MTQTLIERLEALTRATIQTADDIRYYSGGPKHNQAAEDLTELVMQNLPTIIAALRAQEVERSLQKTQRSQEVDRG